MVNFVKKNLVYILLGIIIVLVVAIGICICLIVNKPAYNGGKIVCTKTDTGTTNKEIVSYDKTGKLVSREYTTTITYKDDENYEAAKGYYNTTKLKYKTDDKNKSIAVTTEAEPIKNEDGEEVVGWYVAYQKTLEANGYTCK